ncbi:MAG: hypothetical protein Q8Q67_00715 [bacterium]|nr:hypothetical protein [bacterium]
MARKKNIQLDGQEELILLHVNDIGISAEQLKALEGPENQEGKLELPDLNKVRDVLRRNGFDLLSEREACSGGSFGPLFKLRVKSRENGQEFDVIERTYSEVKEIERRFALVNMGEVPQKMDSEPRYELINHADHKDDKLVVDYLYNEAKAMAALQGTKGIPKFYGAAYDGLNGSLLMEYVEGPDFSEEVMTARESIDITELLEILEKVKVVYREAAEKGYIHHNPAGGTIMIDKNKQPFLTDWYLYCEGIISEEGPMKSFYLEGLKEIEALEKSLLSA